MTKPTRTTTMNPSLLEALNEGAKEQIAADTLENLSPFEKAPHSDASSMTFGQALICIKRGDRVARAGWNGKGMFLFLVKGSRFTVNREPLLSILGEGTEVEYHAHIDMKTVQGYVVPWLASQTDMLAEDWRVVG